MANTPNPTEVSDGWNSLRYEAYSDGDVKPLSLHLGYGYSKIGSNLLMARRRTQN